jgi:hypothetical protein
LLSRRASPSCSVVISAVLQTPLASAGHSNQAFS